MARVAAGQEAAGMVIGRDKGKDGAPGARAAWPSAWAAMPGRGIRAGGAGRGAA
jgi:hypothetical protein